MYASVHADQTGRLLISDEHRASGWNGAEHLELTAAVPLPPGARLVPLAREAEAIGRDGRPRGLGRGRSAIGAVLPAGHVRLLHPSYSDDRSRGALAPLPYAAAGATRDGEIVVAAAALGRAAEERPPADVAAAMRSRPRNDLLRQLARCARENECRAARAALDGAGELPVPLGAPQAERPAAPIALRSGYPGSPGDRAVLRPSREDVRSLVGDGTRRVSFGRACDGEPLLAIRALEDAIAGAREAATGVEIHLETTGCSAPALRRAIEAGVASVTFRFASAVPATYRAVHGPLGHEWSDVRASLNLAAESGIAIGLAVLLLPGLTDRATEADTLLRLIGDMPGGTIELRDLGADPVRTLAALGGAGRPLGLGTLIERLREATHFHLDAAPGGVAAEAFPLARP